MSSLRHHLRHLPALLGVCLLVGAIYVVQKEFRNLKLEDISAALEDIPARSVWLAFMWTFFSYFVLTFYDRLGTIYAGHRISYWRAAFASFCAYALSHNLGFAAVSGAAVRYRLYAHWGMTPVQIAKTVAFCSLTFGLGGMVLGGIILFIEPGSVPFFGALIPRLVMYAIGVGLWGIVAAYVILSKVVGRVRLFGHEFDLPGFRMALVQVLLATVDVAVTASIFYALLPAANGLTWLRFLGVYVASYTAGLAANLPGGIGVFDTAMLLGLSPWLEPPQILGAIVVFRLLYYIIPLFLAGALFAGNEVLVRGNALVRRQAPEIQAGAAPTAWTEPDFAVAAVTGTVALCGTLLLGVGLLAQPPTDIAWADPDFVGIATSAGHFVPSLIGAGLLVLSIGLSQRVNLAWILTILLLVLGGFFAVVQGRSPWVAGVLVFATMLVAPLKSFFYRHARLFSGPLDVGTAVPLLALICCVLALTAFERHVRFLSGNSWWEIALSSRLPNGVRFTILFAVVLGLFAAWRLIRPGRVNFLPWTDDTIAQLRRMDADVPPRADGVVLGEAERAAIPFLRCGNVLLGLGDPTGLDSDKVSAIWRLRDLARQEGLDPAVWNAGAELLKIYSDLGLTALPLGPDGSPMPEAPDDAPLSDRYLACVAERDLGTLLPMLPALSRSDPNPRQRHEALAPAK
ncbi:MAG: lysylphosphatidylglycerol synthetase family protein [Acetobacteraceae bacterium]|nr:lysylphosphatidylglycerol synthetase family protein [Acetobacteraceae bacterium]